MNKMTIFNDANSKELKDFEKNISTYMGIFYVMEYGDYVKIGYSHMPYERLTALKRQAVKYSDLRTGKIALSIPHTNYRENEKQLHAMFNRYRKQDTELFKIDFEDCIKLIESSSIKYKDESKEMKEESDQFLEEFKRFMFYGINEMEENHKIQSKNISSNTNKDSSTDSSAKSNEFSSVVNCSSVEEICEWTEKFLGTKDYCMLMEIITDVIFEGGLTESEMTDTIKKEFLEYEKEKQQSTGTELKSVSSFPWF